MSIHLYSPNESTNMPTTSLHPRLAEVVDYLAQEREQVYGYVKTLPNSVLTRRGRDGQWTVAEIMEHLSLIEDGLGRLFSTLVKQARGDGGVLDTETSSILQSLDKFELENPALKLVAPVSVRPQGEQSVTVSMEKLDVSRARLLDVVAAANGLDLNRVAAPHPFLGPITAYQWLVLIGTHELRHLRQMQNTVGELEDMPS